MCSTLIICTLQENWQSNLPVFVVVVIKYYGSKNWIKGVSICRKAPVISHMLFADDSYVFCKAEVGEAGKKCWSYFIHMRRPQDRMLTCVNRQCFSTNVITNNRSDICHRLQMLEADDQTKYHGLRNIKEKQVCDFWLFKRQSEWKSP